jgi:hypothetical protein
MGLDTSHDAWHGAYGAFTRWRNKLAEVAGYTITKGDDGYESADIDWDVYPIQRYDGDWDDAWVKPADPLIYLIVHSDCDGVIHPREAALLADRLEELVPLLPDGEAPGHVRHWRNTTTQFMAGLRAAVAAGEDVEFR